jgi:hypothetical protein
MPTARGNLEQILNPEYRDYAIRIIENASISPGQLYFYSSTTNELTDANLATGIELAHPISCNKSCNESFNERIAYLRQEMRMYEEALSGVKEKIFDLQMQEENED